MNLIHMRFAAIAAGVVVLGLYLLLGGSLGQPEVIQLDYSMYPDQLEGAQVEIDGRVVGKLEATGQTSRSGFEVQQGRHVVRVLHPEIPAEEIALDVRKGEKVRLLLDLVARYDERTGVTTHAIGAQR
jgi:hypothetical protein